MTPRRATRGELLEVASSVAWNLKAYDNYHRSTTKATRALKRRCPGFTDLQYANALQRAIELYEEADLLVRTNPEQFWDEFHRSKAGPASAIDELAERFRGFRKSTIRSTLGMIFYYWHLR
jgi:hypothetical protein